MKEIKNPMNSPNLKFEQERILLLAQNKRIFSLFSHAVELGVGEIDSKLPSILIEGNNKIKEITKEDDAKIMEILKSMGNVDELMRKYEEQAPGSPRSPKRNSKELSPRNKKTCNNKSI